MKKKWLFLPLPLLFLSPISIIACSSKKIKENNNLSIVLNDYINDNSDNFNSSNIVLNSSFLSTSSETNLFKILLNEDWKYNDDENNIIVDNVFSVNSESFNIDKNRYDTFFNFDYFMPDSFGTLAKPYVSNDKKYIEVPVLLTISDKLTNESISKYIDFFSLQIIDITVNNKENYGFNNTEGKTLIFNNKDKEIQFQHIPNVIIDKYLDFNLLSRTSNLKNPVRYPDSDYNFKKWNKKTLTEVKSLNNAIRPPLDYRSKDGMLISYNIIDSYFDWKDPKYARFDIEFKLKNENDNSLIDNAKEFYGIDFYKKYSYVDKRWEFALPSSNDIDSVRSKNDSLAAKLVTEAKESYNLYLPIVNISYDDVNENGVEYIVRRFDRTKKDFLPPKSFDYIVLDDDVRNVWFEITSLETVNDQKDKIKVNISLNIGEKKLKGSETFFKIFNTALWKWEIE